MKNKFPKLVVPQYLAREVPRGTMFFIFIFLGTMFFNGLFFQLKYS